MARRLPSLPLIMLLLAAIVMSYQVAFVAKSLARVEIVVHYVPEDKKEHFHIPQEKPQISYDTAVSAVVQEFESDRWDPLGLKADPGTIETIEDEAAALAVAAGDDKGGAAAEASAVAAVPATENVDIAAAPIADSSDAAARGGGKDGSSTPSADRRDAAPVALPDYCHAMAYTEFWGDVVLWSGAVDKAIGADKVSPLSCCELCRRTPHCNAWVQCTNASFCQQQCWLKAISDPRTPPIAGGVPGVTPWMSGAIWPEDSQVPAAEVAQAVPTGAEASPAPSVQDAGVARRPMTNRLKLTTSTGVVVRARLQPELSPAIVRYVQQVAGGGAPVGAPLPCTDRCNFYRAEPVPDGWGQNGFWGPPYALLQGSLEVPDVPGGNTLAREGRTWEQAGVCCGCP
eukprot:jgi/Mesvir1/9180/Mv06916-RA.1